MDGDATTRKTTALIPAVRKKNRHPLLRLLMNQNPFYLISVAFVFHGTSLWFRASPDQSPWVLMGLVAGFILLMAVTAFVLVRWGRVWDDARSIFVLVLVLFVELAMAFDDTLVLRPRVGVPLLLGGYGFCSVVFEGLLRGLRVRLPAAYRVPLHLMMAMLFLYPLTVLPSIQHSLKTVWPWQLFGFAVAVGLVALTLVPAVRGGRRLAASNGTPWPYPLFPWVPVGVVLVGLCIRAYAACASLDPSLMQTYADAMKLQSIFAGYFAVPLVLALGVLLLEAGRRSTVIGQIGLLMPVVAVWLSMPSATWTTPQETFAMTFADTLGSPLFATLVLSVAFFGFGWFKRNAGAGVGLSVATLLLLFVGPESMDFAASRTPNVLVVSSLVIIHSLIGSRRKSVPQCCLALAMACFLADSVLAEFRPEIRFGVEANAILLGMIAAGVVTRSAELQVIASCLATAVCGVALLPVEATQHVPQAWRLCYSIALFALVLGIAIRWRLKVFAIASAGTGACLLGFLGYQGWLRVKDLRGIRGLLFYAAGLFWFLLAAAISVAKARHRERGVSE